MAEHRWLSVEGDDGWDEFAGLFTSCCREAIPTDRPSSAAQWLARARDLPAGRRSHHLLAVEDGEAVGAAVIGMDSVRPKSAWLAFLFVVPEHRRRGLGSCLFETVRDVARADGRVRIRVSCIAGDPAAEAFALGYGARRGLVTEQNRCRTAGLDRDQLRAWRDRAAERAAGYSLVAFDGVCPDEHLDAFVAVIPIMNTAPRVEGTEDFAPSRQEVHDTMSSTVRQGTAIWTACARHDGTGEFVGYTEIFFPEHCPWLAAQGDTGVHPDHRGRGIGRWLKAHNALRLLAQRPDVEFIETWNAARNAAMLSINRAMGFEVVARRQEWDVPT